MTNAVEKKIALAVQGSFGHIFYATGILDAFRANNHAHHATDGKRIIAESGSGCVEMSMPLALYLSGQDASTSFGNAVLNSDSQLPPLAQESLALPAVRPDAWKNYFSGLFDAQRQWAEVGLGFAAGSAQLPFGAGGKPFNFSMPIGLSGEHVEACAKMIAATEELAMYGSGLPGQFAFNPLYVEGKKAQIAQLFSSTKGPTLFTNATRADDLSETYLYCGAEPTNAQVEALCGHGGKRQLLRLTPEYFFASGARPPYFAPMPVKVDGTTQHWMEGAMRCNPPLTPLIDVGATHLVLLRFFGKDNRAQPHNNGEMNDRFLDAMFSIPLQKEVESIEFNNRMVDVIASIPENVQIPPDLKKRRKIRIVDPADRNNPAFSMQYNKFLNTELNGLSHYTMGNRMLEKQMYERGLEIGTMLIPDLLPHI